MRFPFKAVVFERQDKGPLKQGDEVLVKKIEIIHDLYRVVVEIEEGSFPLCDLMALNKKLPNDQPLRDDFHLVCQPLNKK